MRAEPDLSTIATLIGDPTRASILSILLGGLALPASELAYHAHVTPQTMSAHLAKLVEGGLLEVNRMGRHRYYRLKNAEVAQALEALTVISPRPMLRSIQKSAELEAMCFARTCYDHLAGRLGVALTDALLKADYLWQDENAYLLTSQGEEWLATWGIVQPDLLKSRRKFAYACLDWSERQPHLAGALGAALVTKLLERQWIKRLEGTRTVELTDYGRLKLWDEFSLRLD